MTRGLGAGVTWMFTWRHDAFSVDARSVPVPPLSVVPGLFGLAGGTGGVVEAR